MFFLKDYSQLIYKHFSLLRTVLLSYLCLAENGRRITTRADRPVRSPFRIVASNDYFRCTIRLFRMTLKIWCYTLGLLNLNN